MANQSAEKEKKRDEASRGIRKVVILGVSAFHILIVLYLTFLSGKEYTAGNFIGFIILSCINYFLNELLTKFNGSFFFTYILDIFGLNLAVTALVPFYWKFWFLYLLIPIYILYKGGDKLFAYVKTIGKEDNTSQEETIPKDKIKKTKIINSKHN